MARILLIDDDALFSKMLLRPIALMKHETAHAGTLGQGLKMVEQGDFDVVYLDVRLPDGNGLEALPRIREARSEPEIIIVTGEGDPDGAELAIKNGAWDYIEKPSSLDKMTLPLVRALEYRERKSGEPVKLFSREGILGSSEGMRRCLELAGQAASSKANALITGETGTGKELFARAIHANSKLSSGPFVVVDCGSLTETLLESALFGYVKGAFTGADRARQGLIEQADKGTLFLDEVGELPLSQQKAFLRVLQEKRFRPVGSQQEVTSDFRLLAATNRNLEEMVESGTFRSDLMFRLKSLVIELPPLRERDQDVKELAIWRMDRLCESYGLPNKGFSQTFFEPLLAYDWPGNVRELQNVLERALIKAGNEPILFSKHLPTFIRAKAVRTRVDKGEDRPREPVEELGGMAEQHEPAEPTEPAEPAPAEPVQDAEAVLKDLGITADPMPQPQRHTVPKAAESQSRARPKPWKEFREQGLAEVERRYLVEIIEYTGGNITEAGRVAGLSRQRLHALLKKHGLQRSYSVRN